ncbi:MAG: hypothetical protein KGY74_02260, partial [Candidatus Cloacimonetes bacterium]|nr:hypothetical protein [Candidatus Cloacimonadota bacterium]
MKKTLLLFAIFIFVFTLSFAARRTDEVFELPDDYGSKFQNNVKGDRSADFTITLTDDFGDGWNGGALDLFVNGSLVLDAITLSSGSGPENFTFTVEQDDSVFVDYTAGSWSYENAYYIYDNIGVLIASSGDGGVTPGDVSFFASPVDITTIYDIQYTTDPSGDSPYLGDVVTTTGIVTATDGNGTHFIQSGSGPWNGLYIHDYSHDYEVGHQVLIMGEVDEYYNKTELKDVSDLDTLATGVDIPPASEISTNEVNQEEYEGVLVSVSNATCVSDTNTYGEWEVDDGSGVCMIDDVFYHFDPEVDGTYYVTGPVDYSYGSFEILPRT